MNILDVLGVTKLLRGVGNKLSSIFANISTIEGRLTALENPGYELVVTKPTASASTMGKMYLIDKTGGVYERWITVLNNGNYVWQQLSDLGDLDLSGYVKAVTLTETQYTNLTPAEKNNGDYYFIIEDE